MLLENVKNQYLCNFWCPKCINLEFWSPRNCQRDNFDCFVKVSFRLEALYYGKNFSKRFFLCERSICLSKIGEEKERACPFKSQGNLETL